MYIIKQKQAHMYKEQTNDYQRGWAEGKDKGMN